MIDLAKKLWRERVRPWLRPSDADPDFLILGAQKAGTTWLTFLLRQQATMLRPKIKEIHYFDSDYGLGRRWYRSNFKPLAETPAPSETAPVHLRYEATPDYLFYPEVAERIARDLPDAKLVILLRDPVSRALSGYHHMVRHGLETRSFAEAVRGEDIRYGPGGYHRSGYVARGRYAEQIARYRERFSDDQILILLFEDLVSDPQGQLDRLSEFLGAPLTLPERQEAQNTGDYAREMDAETEKYIRDQTDASSAEVFKLLGRERLW